MLKQNNKDLNVFNILSISKAWITKLAHHNVSLRSGKVTSC